MYNGENLSKSSKNFRQLIGIEGDHLLDLQTARDVGGLLPVHPDYTSTLDVIEKRRFIDKALLTLSEISLLAGLGCLGSGQYELGLEFMAASYIGKSITYMLASHADRLARNVLVELGTCVMDLPLADNDSKQIDSLLALARETVPSNERRALMSPGEDIFWRSVDAFAASGGNLATFGWLAAGGGLLALHDRVVKKWYGPMQKNYLDKSTRQAIGSATLKDVNREAWKPSIGTVPINGLGMILQGVGFWLAYGEKNLAPLAVIMPTLAGIAGSVVTTRNDMNNATNAQSELWQTWKEKILPDIPNMILNDAQWNIRRKELRLPPVNQLMSIAKGIDNALFMQWNYVNPRNNVRVEVRTLIDGDNGAYLIIGENGMGKSMLVNLLAMQRRDGDGYVGIKDKNRFINLADIKNFDELRKTIRIMNINRIGHNVGVEGTKTNTMLQIADLTIQEAEELLRVHDFSNLRHHLKSDLTKITDKSQGEQILLATIAQLERAKKEGVKVFVVDEPFGRVSESNVQKMWNMFNEYSKQGMLVVVVAQDLPKLSNANKIRGSRLNSNGMHYIDESFVINAARNKDLSVQNILTKEMWLSMLGFSFDGELGNKYIFDKVTASLQSSDLLHLIGAASGSDWMHMRGTQKVNVFSSENNRGFSLLKGFEEYWEKKLKKNSATISITNVEKMLNQLRVMSRFVEGLHSYYRSFKAESQLLYDFESVMPDLCGKIFESIVKYKYWNSRRGWVTQNVKLRDIVEHVLQYEPVGKEGDKFVIDDGSICLSSDLVESSQSSLIGKWGD